MPHCRSSALTMAGGCSGGDTPTGSSAGGTIGASSSRAMVVLVKGKLPNTEGIVGTAGWRVNLARRRVRARERGCAKSIWHSLFEATHDAAVAYVAESSAVP